MNENGRTLTMTPGAMRTGNLRLPVGAAHAVGTLPARRNSLIAVLAALVTTIGATGVLAAPFMKFSDASSRLQGFVHQTSEDQTLGGVAWLDYDGDGDLDLFIANGLGYHNGLMRNNGDGSFSNVGPAAGLGDALGGSGVVAADLDNDGDPDIVVAGEGAGGGTAGSRISLFRNDGDGTFTDISSTSGLVVPAVIGQAQHLAVADIDNDALLDLFVVAPGHAVVGTQPPNMLFHNQGDLVFSDISAGSGVDLSLGTCVASFTDYDLDGLQDLVLANCNDINFQPTPISIMHNDGDLSFSDWTVFAGLDTHQQTPERGFWMCIGLADYDNDADFDIFSTNLGPANAPPQTVGLFQRQDGGTFQSVEDESGLAAQAPEFGWGCSFADLDNDGYEDLLTTGSMPGAGFIGPGIGNPGSLFANRGDGTFERVPLPVNLSSRFTSGLAVGDYDADGFIDVAIAAGAWEEEPVSLPVLLENYGNFNRWLQVKLVGDGQASNRDAIGARVRLVAGALSQEREVRAGSSFLSQDSTILHFGLGQWCGDSTLTVRWPSGTFETFTLSGVNRRITITEGQVGLSDDAGRATEGADGAAQVVIAVPAALELDPCALPARP